MERKDSMKLFLAASILLFPCAAAAQTTGPTNDVPIRIVADGDPPSQVVFEDSSGTKSLTHVANYWEGHHSSKGAWAVHKLALFYSDSPVLPLALRTLWTRPSLEVTIAYHRYTGCNQPDVDLITKTAKSESASALTQAVIGARQLLMLTANACPPFVRHVLADVYFNASCTLAKTTDYFVVSEEAKNQLIANAANRADAQKRIASCDKDMRRAAVQPLVALQDKAIRDGHLGDFLNLNAELAAMRSAPEWADVLAEPATSTHLAQSSQIGHLLVAAQNARDPDQAVATNAALVEIGRNPEFAEAVHSTGLNVQGLQRVQSALLARALEAAVAKASPAERVSAGPK
jgi:hypothetical protein